MAVIFQLRRGTAAAAAANNPILHEGEMGIETDTVLYKLGDGVTPWNSLPYGGLQGIKGDDGADGDVAFDGGTWGSIYQLEQNIDGGSL